MTRRKQHLVAAVSAALLMSILAVTSALDKAPTFDEPAHLAGGVAALELGDFRINPENGILPQEWEALPVLFAFTPKHPIDTRSGWWRKALKWNIATDYLFRSGNDHAKILLSARVMVVALAAACAMAVFLVSRRIWGSKGGLLSIAVFALSPTVLANARLATSDIAAALFFILAAWTFQNALDKLTATRFLAAAAAAAALFLSKMSAPIIIPVFLITAGTRIFSNRPWTIAFGKKRIWRLEKQHARAAGSLALIAAIGVSIYISIWAAFGFRYAMLSDEKGALELRARWELLLNDKSSAVKTIAFAKKHRLFPESYLYGYAYVFRESRMRHAFLNGKHSITGWWYFFPATFAMKTPPETIILIILGLTLPWIAFRPSDPKRAFDRRRLLLWKLAAPTALVATYALFSLTSHLNIGHRHLLPIYPPLAIAVGGAALLLRRRSRTAGKLAVTALVAGLAIENVAIFPDYLAYFSPLVGGPDNGYKHLVDSSLDWGQDLARLKKHIEQNKIPEREVYMAYFGSVNLTAYGMPYKRLLCCFEQNTPEVFPLRAGTYCVSATMLQMAYFPRMAEWNDELEKKFRKRGKEFRTLYRATKDEKLHREIIAKHGPAYWALGYREYERLRFAKLAAALRGRKPDADIGHSIFIYNLSNKDLQQAIGKEL
jgi:hypothetical protein